MALIVTGHPRSGTQLLQKLLDSHPAIRLTNEFGCFRALGVPKALYGLGILGRCWARRSWPILNLPGQSRARQLRRSYAFEAQFLARLRRLPSPLVQAADVEALLRALFPEARIVGDKLPDYVFSLHQFASAEALSVLVIYRDGRDVVASYLDRLRNGWNRLPVFSAFDTPEKIAGHWVEAVAQMQRHKSNVLAVRYEDLVQHPAREVERIGQWLNVPPDRFARDIIRPSSIGRYRDRLSAEERAAVQQVAGPTLEALGYA